MSNEFTLYVRLIDGSECWAPVAARENPDGTCVLLSNRWFDPEDSTALFEFLPGDIVRAERRVLDAGEPTVPVATELVRSSDLDREYWMVLFSIVSEAADLSALPRERLRAIAARIRSEIETGARRHYSSVIAWANTLS